MVTIHGLSQEYLDIAYMFPSMSYEKENPNDPETFTNNLLLDMSNAVCVRMYNTMLESSDGEGGWNSSDDVYKRLCRLPSGIPIDSATLCSKIMGEMANMEFDHKAEEEEGMVECAADTFNVCVIKDGLGIPYLELELL